MRKILSDIACNPSIPMHKLLFLIAIALWSALSSFGQGLPEDDYLPLDDSVAGTVESVEIFGSPPVGKAAPQKASLRARLPAIGNMQAAPAGESLGWAIGYYATSMLYGLKPDEVLSPYFLFDMLTKANTQCQLPSALYMKELKQILLEVGCLRKSDYPNRGNCTEKPKPVVYQNKPRYRAVLNTLLVAPAGEGLGNLEVLYAIRRRVNAGMPIMGIMKADKSFKNLKSAVWKPAADPDLRTYALVIVGYDDFAEEVEVVNCLGREWGSGGFAKIKYEDLYHFQQVFQLSRPTPPAVVRTSPKPTPAPPGKPRPQPPARPVPSHPGHVVKPTASDLRPALGQLAGAIRLRVPGSAGDAETVRFENVACTYRNGLFEASGWPVGQQFQLVVDQLTPATYLYLFSVDGHGEASIHWPQKASLGNLVSRPYSALVSDGETSFLLPRARPVQEGNQIRWQDRVFTKEAEGTDYLVILHASQELSDHDLLALVNGMGGNYRATDFMARLRSALGRRIPADPGLRGEGGQIRYVADSSEGDIVPVVLRID